MGGAAEAAGWYGPTTVDVVQLYTWPSVLHPAWCRVVAPAHTVCDMRTVAVPCWCCAANACVCVPMACACVHLGMELLDAIHSCVKSLACASDTAIDFAGRPEAAAHALFALHAAVALRFDRPAGSEVQRFFKHWLLVRLHGQVRADG